MVWDYRIQRNKTGNTEMCAKNDSFASKIFNEIWIYKKYGYQNKINLDLNQFKFKVMWYNKKSNAY